MNSIRGLLLLSFICAPNLAWAQQGQPVQQAPLTASTYETKPATPEATAPPERIAPAQSYPSRKKGRDWDLIPDISMQDIAARNYNNNPERNYISISVENDLIGGGTDQFYTSGVRLTYFNVGMDSPDVIDTLDKLLPIFSINNTTSTYFTLGHNIYTPEDITIEALQDDDRPWAAFLYGSIGLSTYDKNHIDDLELTLGIVGPEAFGEDIQSFVHENISSSPNPEGWDNQIEFEPGVILSWQRRWPAALAMDAGDYRLAVEPNINASIGNIYTYGGAGVMLSFGPYQGYLQDTPPKVRPNTPGSGYFETPDQGWSWYVFAGADGRAVARNIFLDGNTFRDSDSVEKEIFVGDLSAGFAITLDNYRLAYSINSRSDEFKGQSGDSVFGSVTLSTRF
jgi:lipid A 3-O-deacylase